MHQSLQSTEGVGLQREHLSFLLFSLEHFPESLLLFLVQIGSFLVRCNAVCITVLTQSTFRREDYKVGITVLSVLGACRILNETPEVRD